MNNILLTLLFFLIPIIILGQTQVATTSAGLKVILNADGTWEYADKDRIASETERKKIEAEQKQQADILNKTREALANSKNAGTTSTSEGEARGLGNQGNISYDLGGRGFLYLPKPNYDYQGEGKVVVEVNIDRSGKVIQAIPGSKGSTNLDEYLLKVAKEAALKARFEAKSDAPVIQKGTITYNFMLR
jgi:colicin import membrane protein